MPGTSPGMTAECVRLPSQNRQRQGLRARHDAVEFEIFLRRMRKAADRADAADGWRADRGGEAGIGAPAGELTLERGETGLPCGRLIALEQRLRALALHDRREFALD